MYSWSSFPVVLEYIVWALMAASMARLQDRRDLRCNLCSRKSKPLAEGRLLHYSDLDWKEKMVF